MILDTVFSILELGDGELGFLEGKVSFGGEIGLF